VEVDDGEAGKETNDMQRKNKNRHKDKKMRRR
jgi:hypothetical protein